jgi:hypothetical protein
MKKIVIAVILVVACVFTIGYFSITNFTRSKINVSLRESDLMFQMPEVLGIAGKGMLNDNNNKPLQKFVVDEIFSMEFKLVEESKKLYLQQISPINQYFFIEYRQLTGKESDRRNRWQLSCSDGINIQIIGYRYCEFGSIKVELNGIKQKNGLYEGTGLVSFVGLGNEVEQKIESYKHIYTINWQLFPKELQSVTQQADNKFKTVTLNRPFPKPDMPRTHDPTEEELELWHRASKYKFNLPSDISNLHRTINNYPDATISELCKEAASGRNSNKRDCILYVRDNIFTDIDVKEIGFGVNGVSVLPGTLIILDYLATIEEDDIRNHMLQYQCQDKSGEPFLGQDLKPIVKIPLLFLLVYYNDWLTPERVEHLSKASNRLRLIVGEVKKYGQDSPKHLDEIMVSVLSKMSAVERRDYFVKSLRLRDYVGNSTNESLSKLLPNDLPPPPGPPENMRTWTVNGKKFVGAFVSVDIKSDFLTIVDSEREEMRFYFSDTSKEDQAYVKEQLAPKPETPKTGSSP